jgi:cytochrome c peroxidase
MQFAFKTPTLREVELRSPYMHDGSESNLDHVISFYDRGGDDKRASLAPEVTPLHLTVGEKQDLLEFLKTLTGPAAPVTIPALPR